MGIATGQEIYIYNEVQDEFYQYSRYNYFWKLFANYNWPIIRNHITKHSIKCK